MDNERYQQGLQKLSEVDGQEGTDITDSLGDLGRYIVEFAFGDIYSRGTLSLREREMITIAMLAVLGREPQLGVHIRAGMHVGLTQEEIEEVIIHSVPYNGFPTAINALNVLRQNKTV
ncbi:carboxymuconolactone decarboxylase family protein [Christensenella timonensis]|uniref:carboxymuconolactone decarboxylase family protein n=1 Tax=Christensenella timonensis TaxID=1816678 RepID=UPI00082F825C|nr:carboxymuconolactone decarboxylase family protein [Christensenella timonensis]